jgi:methionyl-tRNA formyltransferase
MNQQLKIVFMGTPDFAVPCLDILVQNGFDIVGVVTASDKIGGRGGKELLQSAVKKYAVAKGLRTLQPEKLRDPDFLAELKSLNADLQVVVAFRMLPEVVWNMPKLGTINLHGSLLPAYRGAAPIHWAVINGEKETGVTTFFLQHEIDTGDILLTSKMSISETETTGDVHDRMMELGAETVLASVKKIQSGDYKLTPQDNSKVSKAPKIHFETCEIDFAQPSQTVYNFIRGMSPFPTAWTTLHGEVLKVYKASKIDEVATHAAGTFVVRGKNQLLVATADAYIALEIIQLQGKKRMDAKDFLNGYKGEF